MNVCQRWATCSTSTKLGLNKMEHRLTTSSKLDVNVSHRWIGRRWEIEYRSRSPDLTSGFFPWDVYKKPGVWQLKTSLPELRQCIRDPFFHVFVETAPDISANSSLSREKFQRFAQFVSLKNHTPRQKRLLQSILCYIQHDLCKKVDIQLLMDRSICVDPFLC